MNKIKGINNDRGLATFIALVVMLMMTIIGLAALRTTNDEVAIAGNEVTEMSSFYAAEAGLEEASAAIQQQYETTGGPPSTLPSGTGTINDCSISYETSDNGAAQMRQLTDGVMTGLNALVKTFTITSTATSTSKQGQTVLNEQFECALVPIFQFAIFYDDDIFATPAEAMTINGRVHANGDICLSSANGLNLNSFVTSAGNILYGFKYGLSYNTGGDVRIKDRTGLYRSMHEGGYWLDAGNANWYSLASARWGGRVSDRAFGQQRLSVPISNSGDPHKLIEPESGNPDSYETKATLKFVNNVAYQKVGSIWVDVTADMTTKGIISQVSNKFYDAREGKYVDILDLDIDLLYSQGYAPSNGVIYFSDDIASSSDWPALRLTNATTLGAALTIASENPVYTKGNFNTTSKKPASILCDALTILSGNWDDTKGTLSKSSRVAVNTTVNVSFITGDSYLGPGSYNGGLASLPRFLEYWGSTRTVTILGSMVNLWISNQANSTWSMNYYEPPARNWTYDADLDDPSKLPPQTPMVRVFQRTGWQQQFVGYDE